MSSKQFLQTKSSFTDTSAGIFQRKKKQGRMEEDCRGKQQTIQRKSSNNEEISEVPPIVYEVLQSPGQPLDKETRDFFEPRFGHDFSQVRVHADAKAAESAKAVNALAYTVGKDIAFDIGQYAPMTNSGWHLLAHELAHVVQQGNQSIMMPTSVGPKDNRYEQEAINISTGFLKGVESQHPPVIAEGVAKGTVQRGWPVTGPKTCLEKCRKPMFEKTFGAYSPGGAGGFRLWYFYHTGVPVPGKVWDAFGHCFVACCGTRECGSFTTAVAGKGREFWREYIDSDPHDSYKQDTKNQTLGRSYGDQGKACEAACRSASLSGELDLSAPITEYWTPTTGTYLAPLVTLSPSLKSDTDIRYWVNMHGLSSIGTVPVQEKIRMINRLLDGWVSEDDMKSIEKICLSVNTEGEMRIIDRAISPRATELNFGQREQLRIAIGRRP